MSWKDLSLNVNIQSDVEIDEGEMVCLFVDGVDNPGLIGTGIVEKVLGRDEKSLVVCSYDFSVSPDDDMLTLEQLQESIPLYDWINVKSGDVLKISGEMNIENFMRTIKNIHSIKI